VTVAQALQRPTEMNEIFIFSGLRHPGMPVGLLTITLVAAAARKMAARGYPCAISLAATPKEVEISLGALKLQEVSTTSGPGTRLKQALAMTISEDTVVTMVPFVQLGGAWSKKVFDTAVAMATGMVDNLESEMAALEGTPDGLLYSHHYFRVWLTRLLEGGSYLSHHGPPPESLMKRYLAANLFLADASSSSAGATGAESSRASASGGGGGSSSGSSSSGGRAERSSRGRERAPREESLSKLVAQAVSKQMRSSGGGPRGYGHFQQSWGSGPAMPPPSGPQQQQQQQGSAGQRPDRVPWAAQASNQKSKITEAICAWGQGLRAHVDHKASQPCNFGERHFLHPQSAMGWWAQNKKNCPRLGQSFEEANSGGQ